MAFLSSELFTICPLQRAMQTFRRNMKDYFTAFKNNGLSKKTWPIFDLKNFERIGVK